MTRLRRLINEAKDSAQFRGHRMLRTEIKGFGHKAYSECKDCGACWVVLPRPFYNEADISGDAVAINCQGREK
jgi:hypothetical protein